MRFIDRKYAARELRFEFEAPVYIRAFALHQPSTVSITPISVFDKAELVCTCVRIQSERSSTPQFVLSSLHPDFDPVSFIKGLYGLCKGDAESSSHMEIEA